MTLETGKHNKPPGRCAQRAFTLIELVLVMALLVVAVSMVAPRMADFVRGRALDTEARRMLALMHAGQSRAVSEGMPIVLWFDTKQNTCGLEEETPPKAGDPNAENVTVSDGVQVVPQSASGLVETMFKHLPAIRFLPGGTIDQNSPNSVQLMEGKDALWLNELQNHTGYEVSYSNK
jgi:prepilin-type N-terminal cleavage/methylation domain-containing protein